MKQSLESTAQLTLHRVANAEKLLEAYSTLKQKELIPDLKVSINDLLLYVISRSVLKTPLVNSHFDSNTLTLKEFPHVNLGCAVDTPNGLLVPVIKNADRLNFSQLVMEMKRLAKDCKEGKAQMDDLTGGTFTVSNLGAKRIEYFTPVLNAPETAILGVGTIRILPVEEEGNVVYKKHLFLSLTFDHQAFDGMYAATFLEVFSENIEYIDWLFYSGI